MEATVAAAGPGALWRGIHGPALVSALVLLQIDRFKDLFRSHCIGLTTIYLWFLFWRVQGAAVASVLVENLRQATSSVMPPSRYS